MKVKLVKKTEEARGTVSFYFEKPNSFKFLPGQYMYVTLPKLNYEDPRGATRHFTISLSPTEELLRVTCRIRQESGFKKTLNELSVGDEVEIEGPSGTLILDESENEGSHVFLGGGIGITPFRSFIKYNIDKNLNSKMYLLYSNSDSEHVFKKDLESFAKENKNLKIQFVDTSKIGHLDKNLVQEITKEWGVNLKESTVWLVGPPPFVTALEEVLEQVGVESSNLRTEKFTGY